MALLTRAIVIASTLARGGTRALAVPVTASVGGGVGRHVRRRRPARAIPASGRYRTVLAFGLHHLRRDETRCRTRGGWNAVLPGSVRRPCFGARIVDPMDGACPLEDPARMVGHHRRAHLALCGGPRTAVLAEPVARRRARRHECGVADVAGLVDGPAARRTGPHPDVPRRWPAAAIVASAADAERAGHGRRRPVSARHRSRVAERRAVVLARARDRPDGRRESDGGGNRFVGADHRRRVCHIHNFHILRSGAVAAALDRRVGVGRADDPAAIWRWCRRAAPSLDACSGVVAPHGAAGRRRLRRPAARWRAAAGAASRSHRRRWGA